jgi:hypothetical protein
MKTAPGLESSPGKGKFRMKRLGFIFMIVGIALLLGGYFAPGSAQDRDLMTWNGKKIIIPESSIPRPGRINTNYFFVGSRERTLQPISGVETPGSVACVYKLVSGPPGCPVATSTNVPTGGVGAIAIVDAGDYPTAASDLEAFDNYFGIPAADFQGQETPGVFRLGGGRIVGYRVGPCHGAESQIIPRGVRAVHLQQLQH